MEDFKGTRPQNINMRYIVLRVISVFKPDNKEVISIEPSKNATLVYAIESNGTQHVFPISDELNIVPNDVVLIESYQRFLNNPMYIEWRIVKVIKGKSKEEILTLQHFYSKAQDAKDSYA